jgi:hypothetical protein
MDKPAGYRDVLTDFAYLVRIVLDRNLIRKYCINKAVAMDGSTPNNTIF